jgi:4-amino-4-deoxy-L-arabinose transferase-like glycosyltransferase
MMDKLSRLAASKWAPWIIFITAIITRGIGAWMGGDHSDDGDRAYSTMASNYLAGHGLSLINEFGRVYSWIPPGMAFLNILLHPLFGEDRGPVRILFVLMSAATNVALFYAAKRLLDEKFAWIAAMAWALYPPQWFWASRMNPQVYATNMVIVCLLLLYKAWERRSLILAFVIGALWVTITLFRGEYALGLGVFILLSLIALPTKKEGLAFGAVMIVGWVLAFAPWVYRNYNIHQRFLLITTNSGDNFWKAYNPAYNFKGEDIPFPPDFLARLKAEPNEVDRAALMKKEAFKFMRENPGRAARNVVGNLANFWRPWLSRSAVSLKQQIVYLASYLPLFVLFVLALFTVPWGDPRWAAVGGLLLYKWLIHAPFYIIVRYREAVMPLMALIATYALQYYWKKREVRRQHV